MLELCADEVAAGGSDAVDGVRGVGWGEGGKGGGLVWMCRGLQT